MKGVWTLPRGYKSCGGGVTTVHRAPEAVEKVTETVEGDGGYRGEYRVCGGGL